MVRVLVLLAGLTCAVLCKPLDNVDSDSQVTPVHKVERRFINPLFNLGSISTNHGSKIRTKRSEDECEKLRLCKLHAGSHYSFLAAYELYFVDKENARLWDHRPRTMQDCEDRYGDCYDDE